VRSWQVGLWVMLAPYLLGTFVLVALPALMSAGLAFTSYDALTPPVYVGFGNFRLLAADPLTSIALGNSLLFIVIAVPLRMLAALALALHSINVFHERVQDGTVGRIQDDQGDIRRPLRPHQAELGRLGRVQVHR